MVEVGVRWIEVVSGSFCPLGYSLRALLVALVPSQTGVDTLLLSSLFLAVSGYLNEVELAA